MRGLRLWAMAAVFVWTGAASAQNQIKPYFLVVVDDSGSMNWSISGTDGDPIPPGTTSCGSPSTNRRIDHAKCAIQRVVNAFGDVEFGLISFKQYGTGTRVHVPIAPDNQSDMISWVDWVSNNPNELSASGGTPIASVLGTARDYYRQAGGPIRTDPAFGCRPYYVILLHDGTPTGGSDPLGDAQDAAAALLNTAIPGPNARVETYVIYFGVESCASNGDCTEGGCNTAMGICNVKLQADSIAAAGGTGTAQAASNEDQLALAFSNIIADSILTEVCGNGDEDCDGNIDEGFIKYCDRDNVFGGGATSSLDYCTDPGDDCDQSDDNCFAGVTDEPLGPCGTCTTPPEVCDLVDNNCNGMVDEGNVCMGCVPTGAETCDNRDNDCDGTIDENLTRMCGTNVGACTAGTETCSAGMWMGCTATGGGPETCDNIDNDCDGRVDGITRACGTDVGACRAGMEICINGMFGSCIGRVAPQMEICDGADNDCDGDVDEADPSLGMPCGTDTGECVRGMLVCADGMLDCAGAVGDTPEICNGLDDDCDGVPDDGLGVGEACGNDVGLCQPGRNVCVEGEVVCQGEIAGTDEICNNLDDDCDGTIDEMLPLGVSCGTEEGLCMEGTLQCIDGREICAGEVPPSTETCDCEDNDCDGSVDEEESGSLCPDGSACENCQCALPCDRSEFGFTCPTGKTPRVDGDVCFCVAERCQAETCAEDTVERDDEVRCGGDTGITCVCKNNECTFPCDGVVCMDGLVCDPRSGRCAEDSCRGLGCPSDELCNVPTGECEPDPCASTECEADEACRGGDCVGSCANVSCGSGELCEDGACVDDQCDGVVCAEDEACNPADGECVENMCTGVRCPVGSSCDPVSGECETDPCVGLHCPDGQMCVDGQCAPEASPDAGMDGGSVDDPDAGTTSQGTRVLATGGGGCACTIPGGAPASSGSAPGGGLVALLLLGLIVTRRRRRLMRPFALAAGVSALLLTGGCDVDPFCLDCVDGQIDPDGGAGDGATGRDIGPPTDVGTDSAFDANLEDAGCEEGRTDICNDHDDDCDGEVDEDADTQNDPANCGGCGNVCSPPGAFGACSEGECSLDRCDVGFFNIDGDDENGCEYRCLPTEADDTICDLRDNDCDGSVDEDVDLQSDMDNCGQCGRDCVFANAVATCEEGACVLNGCAEDFFDIDGIMGTGCEYECTPADPPTELCNLADDDCDGSVDEGNPGGGAPCGSDVGACTPGTERCFGGAIVCEGAVEQSTEICNEIDDDCDSTTDEGFITGDIRNCGSCGNVCSYENGFAECRMGACVLVACEDGFWDANNDPDADGCEYECEFQGSEACNGIDDDCDTRVDEGISPPSNFCNPNGVCASATVSCGGAMGWVCDYPSTYEETETRCDNLDNDCNGVVDDPYLTMGLGTICSNGVGACQETGEIVCRSNMTGVRCNAAAAGDPETEVCDDVDNDCDGLVDEPQTNPGTNASYVVEPMVHVTHSGNDFWIYQYEASRTDATTGSSGGSMRRACSRRDVLPWVQVSYPEAEAACTAAGMRLCTETEWEAACVSSSGSCTWAYANSCDTYNGDRCNGNDYDAVPGGSDDDELRPTRSFNQCYARHGGSDSDRIYDMSGNAKEWTVARSPGINPLRGGSYNNSAGGLRCDFDFTVGNDSFQITNVGFRCCSDDAP